jgi:hypothetical protein
VTWLGDHPELVLALVALGANALIEVLRMAGYARAADVVAAIVPHARGLVDAARQKTQQGGGGGAPRPILGTDAAAPADPSGEADQ